MTKINRRIAVKTGASLLSLALATPALASPAATTLPTGGAVVSGQIAIATNGSAMTVTQASERGIINWQSFDIGKNASAAFVQPDASAVTLNRVLSSAGSTIAGRLTSNGKVYVVNPNGVLFTSTAQVDVGGIVAAAGTISDADFLAGTDRFTLATGGSVINKGLITTHDGGQVVLVGGTVSNLGSISAPKGDVVLASGASVLLDGGADGHLQVEVDGATTRALVENGGLIAANGGKVLLTAQGASAAVSSVVSNTGTIEAQTLANRSGQILLLAGMDGGIVNAGGTLDASAPDGGDGGFIETSAAGVAVADDLKVSTFAASGLTGTWLIDPTDYEISSTQNTASNFNNATLSANLETTNVTVSTPLSGMLTVKDAISWSANTTLSLVSSGGLSIKAPITATGTSAGLSLTSSSGAISIARNITLSGANAALTLTASGAGYALLDGARLSLPGASASLTVDGQAYSLIHDLAQLQSVAGSGFYAIANDVDASDVLFTPISSLSGTLAGLGHDIDGLTISRPGFSFVGMIGTLTGTVRDLTLSNVSVQGGGLVGALVGYAVGASISNVHATGTVIGTGSIVGGLAGATINGSVRNSSSAATVTGAAYVGGLIGENDYGAISDSYATGNVTASQSGGGLIGWLSTGSLTNVYASGAVVSTTEGGGLVGHLLGSTTASGAYWDIGSTGQATSAAGTGIANAGAYTASTYSGFDFTDTWVMLDGTRPMLRSEASSVIYTPHALQLMALNLSGSYVLGADIDLSTLSTNNTYGYRSDVWGSEGFDPVGDDTAAFTGTFEGQNHRVTGLTIARGSDYGIGLFGYTSDATIGNVALDGGSIAGSVSVGSLVGNATGGSITNVTSSASVTGDLTYGANVGGLIGIADGTAISRVSASGDVISTGVAIGGLIGSLSSGTITESYATGDVLGSLTQSLSAGIGGFIGINYGTITQSYATGNVTSSNSNLGGFVGSNVGAISNAYATGDVNGINQSNTVGGFVGYNSYSGTVANAFSSGFVSGATFVGGFLGWNPANGAITGSFFNTETSGQLSGAGGGYGGAVGLTSAEMMSLSSYSSAAWSIDDEGGTGAVWRIYDGSTTPLLRTFLTQLTVTRASDTKTYDGLAYAGGNSVTYAGFIDGDTAANLSGSLTYGSTTGFTNAGTYTLTTDGLYSAKYDIVSVDGTLTVNKAALTVTANDATKTYDGLVYNGSAGLTYNGFVNNETASILGGSLSYASGTDAGSYAITASGLTSGNYAISYDAGLLTVNKAALTVVANDASKTYDGLAYAGGGGVTYTGLVNGEDASVLGGTLVYGGSSQGATNAGSYAITASGLTSGNYAISYDAGALTVNKAALTVAANDASKTYDGLGYAGGAGVTYTGLVNGEDASVLGGTLVYGGSSQGATNAGSYAITASGLTSGNYAISYDAGALTVDKAALTVAANDASKTYDGLGYAGGAGVTYTGLVNGEDASVLGGTLAYGGSSQGATNAGSYAITTSGLTSGNYTISYGAGSLTVNKATLAVTANDASKTYDGLGYAGGAGVTYTGLVNGEDASVLGGTLVYGGSSQGATNAGSYAITASGLTSGNYAISYDAGALTVNKAALTVAANDASKTYDGLGYAGGAGVTYTGFVNGEDASVLGGALVYGGSSQGATNAGSYAITASGLTSGNYAISYDAGALTVNKAALTVAANDASKTYDGLGYAGGAGVTYTGLVNGEDASVLGGALVYGGSSQGATNAGSYAITAAGLTSGNYAISYDAGALTVNKAALTVAANDASKTYDGLGYAGGAGVTYTGLVNGEDASVLGGTLAYGGSSQGATNAGSYAITASGLTSGNYAISYDAGALEIDPAKLSIAADSKTISMSGSYLPLTYTVSGLVAGDSAGSVVSGGLSTNADISTAGTYKIDQGSLSVLNSNYEFETFTAGQLTVEAVVQNDPTPTAPTGGALHQSIPASSHSSGNSAAAEPFVAADFKLQVGDLASGHIGFEPDFIR
ncbi:MBG domain-containing protein [Novosphingobium sp. BL-8A]|uniref:MBG domain-containing protein n=1 Tax=Novosphingobium sp. BL-8A TaxID=3127639 RepID=UPI003758115A